MTDAPPPTADPEEVAVTPSDPPSAPAPAAPETAPAAASTGPRRRPALVWALALAALVAAAAVAMALAQRGEAEDLRGERADRREVARVAAAFGEAYLTYDYADVGASSAAVRALATDAFAAGFEETSAPGIQELFASNETTTVATVEEVFVGDVGDGRARALVVVDVAASSTATGTQQLADLSFVLDLVEEGGAWRVSAVAPAPRADISEPAAGSAAPSTTATTTPAPSSTP